MQTDNTQSPPAFSGFATQDRPEGGPSGTGGVNSDAETRSAMSFKQEGAALKDKAMDRLASEADARKEGVSKQLKGVSGALHAAQQDLDKGEGDPPQWLKSGLRQVASTVDLLADRIQDKSSAELVGEVKSFAKTQPVIFLAACAAVGFAAARVFKAGSDTPSQDSSAQLANPGAQA